MLEGLCFAFWCLEGQVELQRALPTASPPLGSLHGLGALAALACRQVYSLIAPVTDYLAVITMMDRSS